MADSSTQKTNWKKYRKFNVIWFFSVNHQNPGPVGRNFRRFRRFHTFFRWCETIAILQQALCPPWPFSSSPAKWSRMRMHESTCFNFQLQKGQQTTRENTPSGGTYIKLIESKKIQFSRSAVDSCAVMPCPISSFESCFRSFFVWPSVATLQENRRCQVARKTQPQESQHKKKMMNEWMNECSCRSVTAL